jgi:hypothetical protein
MWDNRASKRNPKAPDYKCRDRGCDGVVWPPKGQANGAAAPAQATNVKQAFTSGPRIPDMDGAPDFTEKLDELFGLYSACLDHVLSVEVPKLDAAKIGSSPESVSAMTSTLLIQAAKL